jgi:hypothetical protein
MEGRWSRWHFFPFFAFAVAVLYFGPFLNNFFTFDDFKYLENMYLSWVQVLTGYSTLRLVSNLSWWPLFAMFGFDPVGYNVVALLLFTANACLLYFLLDRTLSDRATAFLASAFFVAGSAGVDAVFWKATNSSLISLFFYLSTLICYCNFRRTGARNQYFAALGLFVLAMFSKEEAASLPLIAALMDIVFFGAWQDKKGLIRRLLPFCFVIPVYLAANALVFNVLLGKQAEPQGLFLLRPLYSLVGGATAFYLGPDGFIKPNSLPVYLTALFIGLSFLLKGSRRLLLFGYGWIFLAFLPMSLTGLGQFEPRTIVNSISRYLYLTSIGSAVVFAVVLAGVRQWVPVRVWYGIAGSVILLFIWVHYPQVSARGEQWRYNGSVMRDFLAETKVKVPVFPAPASIYLVHRPGGYSFTEQALRGYYANPKITVLRREPKITDSIVGPVYYLDCWLDPKMNVQVVRVR